LLFLNNLFFLLSRNVVAYDWLLHVKNMV